MNASRSRRRPSHSVVSQFSYTFGDSYDPSAPYIRYGKAKYIERNSAGTGTIIRYAGTYDPILKKFVEATPPAVSPYPKTIGHTCYRLGDPLRYWTSGCEHFGMTVHRKPTKTTYRWLVGDPATGTLKVLGSPGNASIPAPIKIPAPVWNVNQPPPPPGIAPAQPPLVVAVVQAPPAPPTPLGGVGRWGEAIWMKIYKSEFPHVVALDDLVLGGDAVANPDVDPAEVEWKLVQSPPIGKSGAGEMSENGGDAPVGEGSEAVSRRYEYYKYTGQYDTDPSNLGEAFCDDPVGLEQQLPQSAVCGAPDDNGVAGVGDFIGAQNGAVNLLAACANNVSNSISIARSGYSFNFTTKLFSQKITLTNTSNAPIYGPMSLAFDNLGNNVQLSTAPGDFALAFQLNDGEGIGDSNNIVMLSNFAFGGGSASSCPLNCLPIGDASGDANTAITLVDTYFFNSFAQRFTPGSSLSFLLDMSTYLDVGGTPDLFGFSILKDGIAIPTFDDLAADNFLYLNIDSVNPTPFAFASTNAGRGAVSAPVVVSALLPPPPPPPQGNVPEPSSLVLLGLGLVGLVGAKRRAAINV